MRRAGGSSRGANRAAQKRARCGSTGGSPRAVEPDADMTKLLRMRTGTRERSGGLTEAAADTAQIDCAASGQRPEHAGEGIGGSRQAAVSDAITRGTTTRSRTMDRRRIASAGRGEGAGSEGEVLCDAADLQGAALGAQPRRRDRE